MVVNNRQDTQTMHATHICSNRPYLHCVHAIRRITLIRWSMPTTAVFDEACVWIAEVRWGGKCPVVTCTSDGVETATNPDWADAAFRDRIVTQVTAIQSSQPTDARAWSTRPPCRALAALYSLPIAHLPQTVHACLPFPPAVDIHRMK